MTANQIAVFYKGVVPLWLALKQGASSWVTNAHLHKS
uniref:Uncharacterized protein n=1 Tax=Rhodnius prolixus TaxID=13249 RepID=T1HYQ0_RHOPR